MAQPAPRSFVEVRPVPRLSEFYGIVIYMYFADRNPPHFHAMYGEHEALIAIDDGAVIGGALPRTAAHWSSGGGRRGCTNSSPTGAWRKCRRHSVRSSPFGSMGPVALVRVREAGVVQARVLRIVFSDGVVRELDFAPCQDGLFALLRDDEVFRAVAVDPVAGTVSFPGGIDFDTDVLRGDAEAASPQQPVLVRQYRIEHSA